MYSYYLVMALQAFCIYHAYSNRVEQKWYWIILFLPVIGSLIYLYTHFYSRQNIDNLEEGIKVVLNSDYATQKLEKEVEYSDTIITKTRLAEKYGELGRHDEAIALYLSCLEGFNSDSPGIVKKLVHLYYLTEDYSKAVDYGNRIKDNTEFSNSEEKIGYAWALYYSGDTEAAAAYFEDMDAPFSHYPQRMEYARFYFEQGKKEAALEKLNELLGEYEHLESYEKRLKKAIFRSIRKMHADFSAD